MLVAVYLAEVGAMLVGVGLYKATACDWTLLTTKAGGALVVGGAGMVTALWLFLRQALASGSLRRRAITLALGTNLVTVLVAVVLLEGTIRIVARTTQLGIVVGSVAIQPTWAELVARSREVLMAVAPWGTWDASYFVYDRELGWTVGRNRRTPDGLYFSSLEGVRSPGPDLRLADRYARSRVALIGDSHALSFEVGFEDSLGHHLEEVLGDDVQVLNFGVDGYGIDQIYLRYQRDVRPWQPRAIVLAFSGHDLWRTMAVYPFVSFGWPGYIVKPRFVIEKEEPRLLNAPLQTPDQVLGTGRIEELPYIEHDLGYATTDWSWRWQRSPLLFRFLTSVSPRWKTPHSGVSNEAAIVLNSRLLAMLVESIERAGGAPVVVLMSPRTPLAAATLARARVPFLEATGCLDGVPVDRTRVPSGHHYTGLGNSAIARCISPRVAQILGRGQ